MHLVDTTLFFGPRSGGVKRYLLAKRRWLATHTRAHHSLVVPGRLDRDEGNGLITIRGLPVPFADGYRLPLSTGNWRRVMGRLAPDLIEAGDPYTLAWESLRFGQQRGVPVVGFCHSDLIRLLATRFGHWSQLLSAPYVRQLYRQFDRVLAPSHAIADKLRALGVSRIEHQPLGVDTELFHPNRRDRGLRERLGLASHVHLLVFAGRFAREKNIPQLVDAVTRLGPGYHLLLIGAGRTGRPRANVTVLPYQGEHLPCLLAGCDALVHAGDQETFGLVVLEAMACGLPVVGVDRGAVAELIDPEVGCLAVSPRSEHLAEAVAALFEGDWRTLGHDARRRVELRFSWDSTLRLLMSRYAALTDWTDPLLTIPARAVG